MVNCNPETVSTDYDTSRPALLRAARRRRRARGLRARAARRRRDPVRRPDAAQARARDRGRGLPHPRHAVRRRRPRRGSRAVRRAARASSGIRCPEWGIAASGAQAVDLADRIGYPVLVRPSYVLGGRAMRVCHDDDQVREAFAGVQGPTLVDRFLENAIEIDVDALCDGTDTYVAAVMQHVEEAGVHSGDSACVLPAQSLTLAATVGRSTRSSVVSAPRSASSGCSTCSSRSPTTRCSCSRSTRARRGRCRSRRRRPASTSSPRPAARCGRAGRRPRPARPSGRRARSASRRRCLPFARFPGADPVLGPEMRSTGEVMTSANDLPTALAKAERAAGRPLPRDGAVFLSVRDADKATAIPVAAAFVGLGFHLYATGGTARTLRGAGLDVDDVRKVNETRRRAERRRPDSPWPLQPGREHARTAARTARRRLSDPRGGARRHASRASRRSRPRRRRCTRSRTRGRRPHCRLQERIDVESRRASVVRSSPSRRSARTRSCASSGAASTRVCPVSSSCSRRPAVCCRVRCRSVSRRAVSSRSCSTRSVPARARSRRSSRATSSHVFGPLGNGFRLDVRSTAARRRRHRHRTVAVSLGGARASACRPRLPVRAPRRSGSVGAERRGRDRSRARHGGAARRARRARVRTRTDARSGARARARTRSSRGRRRWPAATARATAASSRSTTS